MNEFGIYTQEVGQKYHAHIYGDQEIGVH